MSERNPADRDRQGPVVRRPFLLALGLAFVFAVALPVIVAIAPEPPPYKPDPKPIPASFNDYRNAAVRPPRLTPDAPCRPIHFGFDGNPRKFESDTLGRYSVPNGRIWHITNASLMMERYDGEGAVAGEWTAVLGGVHGGGRWRGSSHGDNRGRWFTIAQSSLDNGSGIALQGQTTVNATLDEGDHLAFVIWLRPDTHPGNYYYTLGASGLDCPERYLDHLGGELAS